MSVEEPPGAWFGRRAAAARTRRFSAATTGATAATAGVARLLARRPNALLAGAGRPGAPTDPSFDRSTEGGAVCGAVLPAPASAEPAATSAVSAAETATSSPPPINPGIGKSSKT